MLKCKIIVGILRITGSNNRNRKLKIFPFPNNKSFIVVVSLFFLHLEKYKFYFVQLSWNCIVLPGRLGNFCIIVQVLSIKSVPINDEPINWHFTLLNIIFTTLILDIKMRAQLQHPCQHLYSRFENALDNNGRRDYIGEIKACNGTMEEYRDSLILMTRFPSTRSGRKRGFDS